MTDGHLEISGLDKTFDDTAVLAGAGFVAGEGAVVALLGPSGSGKTTLLRCIAGLERPDAGRIRLGEAVLTDVAAGVAVAPERRGVGMVFQDWALFPHLDVGDNVGFGLPRGQRRGPRVAEVLELVGLAGFERRHPGTLSGGQQQRVALARALAPRPGALLLDEPFSNLDASLRTQVRTEVHRLLTELAITTVFVTHDQDEAFVLGDSVVVVQDGRVAQQGPPREIYRRPSTPWVAGFVGDANLLPARADGARATTALGAVGLATPRHGSVTVLVRPEDLVVDEVGALEVELVEYLGHDTVLHLAGPDGAPLRVRTRGDRWRPGDRVGVRLALDDATAWPT